MFGLVFGSRAHFVCEYTRLRYVHLCSPMPAGGRPGIAHRVRIFPTVDCRFHSSSSG